MQRRKQCPRVLSGFSEIWILIPPLVWRMSPELVQSSKSSKSLGRCLCLLLLLVLGVSTAYAAPATPTSPSPGSTSSPGPTLSSSTIGLSWGTVSGATYYSLGVRDMNTDVLVVSTTTTSASYTASLTADSQYRWNVAACNSTGCSAYTQRLYFQTPPDAVPIPAIPTNPSPGTVSSPGPTTSSTSVTLSWSAPSGATSYGVGVRDMNTNLLVVSTTTTSTSYTASLTAGGQYRWNVTACNSTGCSSYTTSLYFQTPPDAVPMISSVSPNPVTGSDSAQPFTINGTGFTASSTVTLRDKRTGEVFTNRQISSST